MSHRRSVRRFVVLMVVALAVVPLLPVVAQSSGLPATDLAQYQALLDKAQTADTLRVIVGVKLPAPFRPEGSLSSPRAVGEQRTAIYADQQMLLNELADYKVTLLARFQFMPYMTLQVDRAALLAIVNSPSVSSVQEDIPVPPALASSVPLIGADNVWDAGYDGAGWAVAVLDTGVQWDHPFFGGSGSSRVVSEACYSTNGTDIVSLCPGAVVSTTTGHAADPTSGNCVNDDGVNLCTHGTHVAGIAAGNGAGTSVSYSGVARGANIIAIQVFSRFNSYCGGYPCVLSYQSDQMLGLERVYELRSTYNIAAVNLSLGGGGPYSANCDADKAAMKADIDNLRSAGIATVIASGNEGYATGIASPACISSAVAVGATDDGDNVAWFSNGGSLIALLAPGVSINSSIPTSQYTSHSGTSMATPHVAGAWALLKSVAPTASVNAVLSALQTTGVSVLDTRNSITKPRIQVDVAAAILAATTWLGNSTAWNTADNWSTNQVPSRIINVMIPTTPSGGNFPIVDGDAAAYDLTIASGARITLTTPYTFAVFGNWSVTGTGAFNATTGTVVFRGNQPQTITMTTNADDHFYDLQIGDGTTKQIVSPGSDLNVDGSLEIKSGATLSGSNRTFNVAGNWTDYETNFAPGTGTLVFDGSRQTAQKTSRESVALSENFADCDGYPDGSFFPWPPGFWVVTNAGTNDAWYFGYSTAAPNSPDTGGHARHLYNGDDSSTTDTWLFSPGVDLSADLTYRLEFTYGALDSSRPESLEVKFGNDQTAVSMTTAVYTNTNIVNTVWNTATITFTVPGDGMYNLGFHAYTAPSHGALAIDDIKLTAISSLMFYNVAVNSTGSATFADNVKVKNDLAVAANGIMDLDTRTLTVEGTLTNNGTLRQKKHVSGATEFLHIQNTAGSADKYFGVVITPTATALQTTTVEFMHNKTCS